MHDKTATEMVLKLEPGTMEELASTLDGFFNAVDASDVSIVVLDLRELASATDDASDWPGSVDIRIVTRWERTLHRLELSGKLVVALLGGTCSDDVLEIALAADIRIAQPDTLLSFGKDGLSSWPSMMLFRLVQQVGLAQGRRIVMLGESLKTEQAVTVGLVEVVSADFDVALAQLLDHYPEGGEVRITRSLLREAVSSDFDEALGAHLAACDRFLRNSSTEELQ